MESPLSRSATSASTSTQLSERPTAAPSFPRPDAGVLDRPIQYVRGVGPVRAKLLTKAGIETLGDLLMYFPFRYEDQPPPQRIDTLLMDQPATVIGAVERARVGGYIKKPVINAVISDGTGDLKITWFNAPHMRDRLERGHILRVFGKVEAPEGIGQMTNPRVQWLDPDDDPKTWQHGKLIPVYRAIDKLASHVMQRLVDTALEDGLARLSEPLPSRLIKAHALPNRAKAIRTLHHPETLDETSPARRRLAYEELLFMQLAVGLRKRFVKTEGQAPKLHRTDAIDQRIRKRFPFKLTGAQEKSVNDICADLAQTRPMTRLLQGDVGSGKTVVALYAGLVAVANKTQCAILAPTEVLAAQHFASMDRYLEGSKVRRALLTGKTPKTERDKLFADVRAGRVDLIVGTHALLNDKVTFQRLGVVIVDEQHKFGVSQRASLKLKSQNGSKTNTPHYLVMTATPIPRTLSMTVFGDLDVSVIDELPPGRQRVHTAVVRSQDEQALWLELRERITAGDQIYIVYPLVEESDELDLKAATTEVARIANDCLPGARVGLMHGRLRKNDKQRVMADFAAHRTDVLVSTTVIEVGVDVPNATVMVVQHAERYGLSALHQLRGRVGRGAKASVCYLLSDSKGETAMQRLGILCETNDGFRIAEEDLKIRGPGELLGTRQHGLPEFRAANIVEDVDLLIQARNDAADIIRKDPRLAAKEHAALRAELSRRFRERLAFIDVG